MVALVKYLVVSVNEKSGRGKETTYGGFEFFAGGLLIALFLIEHIEHDFVGHLDPVCEQFGKEVESHG